MIIAFVCLIVFLLNLAFLSYFTKKELSLVESLLFDLRADLYKTDKLSKENSLSLEQALERLSKLEKGKREKAKD